MISETSVAISATPPKADDPLRRNELTRNGCISAIATVKITTATMNPVTSMSNPLRTSEATIRPTAFATSRTPVRTMQANHGANIQQSRRAEHGHW